MPQGAVTRRARAGSARRSRERLAADGLEVVTLDLREGCDIALDVAHDAFPPLEDIDVCVANAGITTTIAPAHRMTAEQWQRDIDVNLTGAFRTVQACLGGMRERRFGRIVVISSVAALGGAAGTGRLRGVEGGAAGHGANAGGGERRARDHGQRGAAGARGHRAGAGDARSRCASARARCSRRADWSSRRRSRPSVAFLAGDGAAQVSGQTIAVDGAASLSQLTLGSERR